MNNPKKKILIVKLLHLMHHLRQSTCDIKQSLKWAYTAESGGFRLNSYSRTSSWRGYFYLQ